MRYRTGGDALEEGCEHTDEDGRCGAVPETMDGVHGRRCDQHPPTYDRAFAMAAVDRGDVRLACAHLRAHVAYRARGAA